MSSSFSKKKLLIILGSGSSRSCGMPIVSEIDGKMKEWSRELRVPVQTKEYFNLLWDTLTRYYQDGAARYEHHCLRPNYEIILGEIIALASWVAPAPFGNPLRQALRDGRLLDDCGPLRSDMLGRQLVLEHLGKLLSRLAQYMRKRSQSLDTKTSEFQNYVSLISRLRDEFEVGIYNLNYDTLSINAWPGAFTGFKDTGSFSASEVFGRTEWGFIYHLHGSVHHSLNGPYGPEIIWKNDLTGEFFDGGHAASVYLGADHKSFPRTSLIAGGFKLEQLLIEPFHSLYASLVRHFQRADAFLVGGYGFGDVHVNLALKNRLVRGGERPPVIVLTKSGCNAEPTGRHNDAGMWGRELKDALDARFPSDPPTPHGCTYIEDLVRRKSFEEALVDNRVAVWHGGFTEAVECLEDIVRWLQQGMRS